MTRILWKGSVPYEGGLLADDEQPCPACDGRADDDCLTCGGEGYV